MLEKKFGKKIRKKFREYLKKIRKKICVRIELVDQVSGFGLKIFPQKTSSAHENGSQADSNHTYASIV